MKDDFFTELNKMQLAFNKRMLRNNYCMFILNFGLFLWNIYFIYKANTHWLTGVAVGLTGGTSLWIWLNIWETRLDIKIEKQKLAYREERDEFSTIQLVKNKAYEPS